MTTSAKPQCDILVELLIKHGVHEAVISPGSRCTPLVIALSRNKTITNTVVIDERSAAFIALGKASASAMPVALVCTSGTALLNYAPAVAEAYYRHIPLVVISADRPYEWIDQDDSQTLRQFEALEKYVKRSYDLADNCSYDKQQWYANRIINDALIMCSSAEPGPVHINMQFDNPLNQTCRFLPTRWNSRLITAHTPCQNLSEEEIVEMAGIIAHANKVLIIGGFHNPDKDLRESLETLAQLCPNIAIMCETIANISSPRFIHDIDATLSALTDNSLKQMAPDIVITFGGAIVSRMVKKFLRQATQCSHWHIGKTDITVDCFLHLERHIRMSASSVFKQLAATITEITPENIESDYAQSWACIAEKSRELHSIFINTAPWSTLKAADFIFANIPTGWALQLSNGTAIRYAQLFPSMQVLRSDCNRGVSGIDGCTSTAIGASTVLSTTTVLVTGDMSSLYDMGAFAAPCISPKFKTIVLCNGGGEIFHFIESTHSLPETDTYMAVDERDYPIDKIANTFGFRIYKASSLEELHSVFPQFCKETNSPTMLCVYTSGKKSAETLRRYFECKL